MNVKIFGEGVLVLSALFGLGMAMTSGFSNAGDASTPTPTSAYATPVTNALPDVAPGAANAVTYSAAGEGTFLANGDLVGSR